MRDIDQGIDPAATGGSADSAGTPAIAELVSQVYDQAPAPLRAKLLECLLDPVGPLALLAIGAGAFSRFLYRLQGDDSPIPLEQAARITSGHVLELARYVEQCDPHVLTRLGSLVSASPFGVATLSGSALLLALQVWRLRDPAVRRTEEPR
jgi:hypothetical protein